MRNVTRNNLTKRKIFPSQELADFLQSDDPMDPLEFMSALWFRLYQSGSVRNRDGSRAHRKRKRAREAAKRRHRLSNR